MIIEGLLATIAADGQMHLVPMGPRVTGNIDSLLLRPFEKSDSLANLRRERRGVFHITDDVLLLARAAIHRLDALPESVRTPSGKCPRLVDCCRWFEFEVTRISETPPRIEVECKIVDDGFVRHWTGFNRAKHAVVEAAILCTRIGILPDAEIDGELAKLEVIVRKTAGRQEEQAFALLKDHFNEASG
jgi:uncharacterized protein